jgi:hypothetical protein
MRPSSIWAPKALNLLIIIVIILTIIMRKPLAAHELRRRLGHFCQEKKREYFAPCARPMDPFRSRRRPPHATGVRKSGRV